MSMVTMMTMTTMMTMMTPITMMTMMTMMAGLRFGQMTDGLWMILVSCAGFVQYLGSACKTKEIKILSDPAKNKFQGSWRLSAAKPAAELYFQKCLLVQLSCAPL